MAHHSFTTEQAATGWKTQAREQFAYWIPEVDVKGTLPKDLVGTFFRNGKSAPKSVKSCLVGWSPLCYTLQAVLSPL